MTAAKSLVVILSIIPESIALSINFGLSSYFHRFTYIPLSDSFVKNPVRFLNWVEVFAKFRFKISDFVFSFNTHDLFPSKLASILQLLDAIRSLELICIT